MSFRLLFFALLLSVPAFSFAGAEEVRVRVFAKHSFRQVEVFAADLSVKASRTDGTTFQEKRGEKLRVRAEGGGLRLESAPLLERIEVAALSGPLTVKVEGLSPRKFHGSLRVENRGGKLFLRNGLSLEDYVRGVLASELPEDFPLEAQKAQAVLARTYAVAERARHAREGFELCDLTHCQVYAGLPLPSAKRDEAVRRTAGQILTHRGKPVAALFHSTCGGHTSPNQRVFGGRPLPYLQGVSDGAYCAASPHSSWQSELPLEQIAVLLEAGGSPPLHGEVTALFPKDRESQGRLFSVELVTGHRLVFSTMDFLSWLGRVLGWNHLKSNWFEIEVKEGVAHFRGRGLGHGVGLCQWGAKGRAEAGMKFPEILRGYFPGTRVEGIRP